MEYQDECIMLCLVHTCLFVILQLYPLDVTEMDGYVSKVRWVNSDVFLAHTSLSGQEFFQVRFGDVINYKDDEYIVSEFALYAVENGVDFIEQESGIKYTMEKVYSKIYQRPDQLVLQTCVERDNDPSWGRFFVIAKKKEHLRYED